MIQTLIPDEIEFCGCGMFNPDFVTRPVMFPVCDASELWWNDSWNNKVGVNITNLQPYAFTGLPVLLNFSTADSSRYQLDCDDVRFINGTEDGELRYELEQGTCNQGNTIFWVKLPSLLSNSYSDNFVYYNNSNAVDGSDKANVWDNDYVLVLHFGENSTATGGVKDSTRFGNNFSMVNDSIPFDPQLPPGEWP